MMLRFKGARYIVQRLRVPDEHAAARQQIVIKRFYYLPFHFIVKIDYHVAAEYDM
jgi:hypothetical protein